VLVQFIYLFAAVYLAAVFYNLIRTTNYFREVMMAWADEMYLTQELQILPVASSVEFVSAHNPVSRSRMRLLLCLCLLLSFALVRHYHIHFQEDILCSS